MFNSIRGTVTGKFPQRLFLENNGIEWDMTVPDTNLDKMPPVGSETKVYVYLQHTDALMGLFGFATEEDRLLFFDLLKVDGIGPKAAVKIMGNISSGELSAVLENGDLARLEKVPGVGKKTAAKMLLQLKGKLTLSETVAAPKAKVVFADVVQALVDMGYDKTKASEAVQGIADSMKDDASFATMNESQKEDLIFRKAIVGMAN